MAELLGAEGRYEEAAGIFERVVSAIDRLSSMRRSASFTSSRTKAGPRSIERALASRVVDALLYFRAGEIYSAAGNEIEGRNSGSGR
jgi:hypothetical protein